MAQEIIDPSNQDGGKKGNDGDDIHRLAKSITLRRGEFEAEIANLPSSVIEALYHEITGKTEKLTYSLHLAKLYSFPHLNDLVTRVYQNAQKYKIVSYNVNVEYRLSDDRKYFFSYWLKFSSFDFKTMARTFEINIIFDFVFKSNIGSFNSYKIRIDIASLIGNTDNYTKDQSERAREWATEDGRTAEITIEYIDSMVARDFYDVIRSWYSNLEGSVVGNYYPFIRKNRDDIVYIASNFYIMTIPICFLYAYKHTEDMSSYREIAPSYIFALTLIFFSFAIGRYSSSRFEKMMRRTVNLSIVKLTDGDDLGLLALARSNRKKSIAALLYFVSLVISIMVNIFSNYAYEYIK